MYISHLKSQHLSDFSHTDSALASCCQQRIQLASNI